MSNCQKLWSIWFITYLIVINAYLTVVSIRDYLDFKYQVFDLAYGGNWSMSAVYVILSCLNVSLGLLPIIIYMSVVPQGNLANDGHVIGRDPDVFHLTVNEHGRGTIVPTINKKSTCGKYSIVRLIYMELPPLSYLLHVISAICFVLPRSFIEGQRIHHGVYKSNRIWHSDLDFVFDPDQQHADFVHNQNDVYIQPVSVAYFNLGLSLVLLSLQYSRVLWYISRQFTIILSSIMILWTVHILVEACSLSVMIKVSLNPMIVGDHMRLTHSAFTIQFLSLAGNIIVLLAFTTIFHYGVLQYADTMVHRNRKSRRQMLNSSPQMIGSNHLDIPGAFSPSVSENNYSESSIEPVFSKSHTSHIIKPDTKSNTEPLFLNGNNIPNHSGTMQLHQMQNSLLRNTKSSEITLSKQDMMALNRNMGLDGCSDETDMSSKLSSNNYVFLQSMRNGQMGVLDCNGQPPMLRNPLYLSYALNSQGLQNTNTIYANDDSINNRSIQLEDQLGSEHSYNSNRSRNNGFENMPPILPNFDENRYKNLNPNSVAMEKLIPRYLRNPSLDYNSLVHLSMASNEVNFPTVTTPTMSYTYDTVPNNFNNNIARYKQSGTNVQTNNSKYPATTMEFMNSEEEQQRRAMMYSNGDSSINKGSYDPRRVARSPPVMFPTLEESVNDNLMNEADCLLPKYSHNANTIEPGKQSNEANNNNNNVNNNNVNNKIECTETVTDRMCSQV